MISHEDFLKYFLNEKNPKNPIQKGKVDPNYTGGQPSVIYDMDIKDGTLTKVNYIANYSPVANDRVLIFDGVIIGKII